MCLVHEFSIQASVQRVANPSLGVWWSHNEIEPSRLPWIKSTLKIARLLETLGDFSGFSNFLGLFQVMTRQTPHMDPLKTAGPLL